MEHEIKVKVLTSEWTVGIYGQRAYARRNGADSRAVCIMEEKRLEFDFKATQLQTIIHELVHAYAVEMAFVELQLDDDQLEEAYCELLSRHYQEIISTANVIYEFLFKFVLRMTEKK